MKKGLCLAGGGVKGAAHVGAIKALEEENVKFDYVGGTSSGSIVATLYACGFTADEMYTIFKKYCQKIKYVDIKNIIQLILGLIFTGKIVISGLNSGKQINNLITKVCKEKNIYEIKDIKMPLVIPSVNLCRGEVLCFTSCEFRNEISDGTIFVNDVEIGKAVQASCSYPVVFSPCTYKNLKLIDGGIRENVPWRELSNYEMCGAEFTLKFTSEKVGLFDMKKIDKLYSLGYYETKKNINKIKNFLELPN